MVDSLKNANALGVVVSQTQAGDTLRKNLKTLSPVSVSNQKNSGTEKVRPEGVRAESSIAALSDNVKLSAEAIRNLSSYTPDDDDSADLVEENIRAASATPDDVRKANETAQRTGSLIQFRKEQALNAHGSGVSPERVRELLAD